MLSSIAFRLTLGLYYLALGTWFGTTLMMGVAAGMTFRTSRALSPVLPDAPRTADRPADYLAGEIVNSAFAVMSRIQVVCAAVVVGALVLQWTLWRHARVAGVRGAVAEVARSACIALAVVALGGYLAVLQPRMGELRSARYDEGSTPAAREAARATFDAHHRLSERLLGAAALAVAGAAVVTPFAVVGSSRSRSEDAV